MNPLTTMQKAYMQAVIKKGLRTKREQYEKIQEEMKRPRHPRYDKVFFEGLRWMDENG
jgi:hypothetical protein